MQHQLQPVNTENELNCYEHHAAMLDRLRLRDAADEAQQAETRKKIQVAGNRFLIIAAIAIVAFLFSSIIGDAIIRIFDQLFG